MFSLSFSVVLLSNLVAILQTINKLKDEDCNLIFEKPYYMILRGNSIV